MRPVLFSVGSLTVSSFGLFLALAFLSALFITWRLARVYDVNEEKIIDLGILTFFMIIFGARLYFILLNPGMFDDLNKMILLTRYPGLSFWGGLASAVVAISLFLPRLKLNFWQVADLVSVGAVFGLIIGDMGCFVGGCSAGVLSNSWLAVPVTGLVGRRFPVSLMEAVLLTPVFVYLWKEVVRFHLSGKIAALFLIFLGLIKFTDEYLRADRLYLGNSGFSHGQSFAACLFIFGCVVYYRRSKRQIKADLVALAAVVTSSKKRQLALLTLRKNWYNNWTTWGLNFQKIKSSWKETPKFLRRKLHVKSTPTNLREN